MQVFVYSREISVSGTAIYNTVAYSIIMQIGCVFCPCSCTIHFYYNNSDVMAAISETNALQVSLTNHPPDLCPT